MYRRQLLETIYGYYFSVVISSDNFASNFSLALFCDRLYAGVTPNFAVFLMSRVSCSSAIFHANANVYVYQR